MSDQVEKMLRDENAAWNVHDADRITTFYTDDCIKEDIAVGKATRGKKEMKALIAGAFTAIPDMKIELVTLFDRGEWAASEWIMSGSYSNDYPGFPLAANRHFSVRGASIMELRDGRISRISDYWDFASFLRQVGTTAGGQQTWGGDGRLPCPCAMPGRVMTPAPDAGNHKSREVPGTMDDLGCPRT